MTEPLQQLVENVATEYKFSAVERETLVLALEGLSLEEIAQRLDRKFGTIQKRMATIYNKVGITGDAPGKLEILRSKFLSQPQKIVKNSQLVLKDAQSAIPVKSTLQNVPTSGDNLYGREEEVEKLREWLIADGPVLICVHGLGGFGKTTLVSKVVREVVENFDHVIWLSLQAEQSLERGLELILQNFADQGGERNALVGESALDKCIDVFRKNTYLLVLEDFQKVLPRFSSKETSRDEENWQSYDLLLNKLNISQHQSKVVVISRKQPVFFAQEEGNKKVHSLSLKGLSERAIEQFLIDRKVVRQEYIDKHALRDLRDLSSGHPLLLKISFPRIKNLFGGDIREFLDTGNLVYGGLNSILDSGFKGFSNLEKLVLYWLLVNRDPDVNRTLITFQVLRNDILQSPKEDGKEILECLDELERQSWIEANDASYKLHDLIEDYIRERFIKDFYTELIDEQPIYFLDCCALIKAKSNDSIRLRQEKEVIEPILQLLQNREFRKINPKDFFAQFLQRIKEKSNKNNGYLAANIVHLCRLSGVDLDDLDFSYLSLRQVDFRGINLHDVSFRKANIVDCEFDDDFSSVLCVRCAPDGRLLASADTDGKISIWDYSSRRLLCKINAHESWVFQVRFSNDGKLLASASEDGTCCIWCLETYQLLRRVVTPGKLLALDFNPNGKMIAVAGENGKVYLLNIQDASLIELTGNDQGVVWSCAFSPDGKYLVHDNIDQTIQLWNLDERTSRTIIHEPSSQCRSLVYSPDGKYLARVSEGTIIRVWDTKLEQDIAELEGHSQDIWTITFSTESNSLISAGADKQIRIWDIQQQSLVKCFQRKHTAPIYSIAYHSKCSEIVSGSGDQTICFWDYFATQTDRQLLNTLQGFSAGVRSISFLPNSYTLIAGSSDQNLYSWKVFDKISENISNKADLEASVFPPQHSGFIWTTSCNVRQNLIASAGEDGWINLWDAHTKQLLRQLPGSTWTIFSVAFNYEGDKLASGSLDENIKLWDIKSINLIETPKPYTVISKAHSAGVRSVCFTHDGNRIVSCGNDKLVKVWDAASGSCLAQWAGHESFVQCIDISSDENFVVSCSDDKTIRIWNLNAVSSNKEPASVAVLEGGHTDWIRSVRFSPDGQLLASGGEDGLVCLWCLKTKERIWHKKCEDNIKCVAFSDDGKLLANGSDDGTVKLWNIDRILNGQASNPIVILRTLQPYKGLDITDAVFSDDQQPLLLTKLGAVIDSLLPD